jgi:DNA-binding CsgD family transcriptional regulator
MTVGGKESGRRPNLGRRRLVVRLRRQGLTLQRIGQCLGITHQAVAHHLRRSGHTPNPACAGCGVALTTRGGPASRSIYCLDCLSARPELPFGVRLRSVRLAAGMSQGDLAQHAGLNKNTIRQQEAGMGPLSAGTLKRLCRVLGQSLAVGVVPRPGRKFTTPKNCE